MNKYMFLGTLQAELEKQLGEGEVKKIMDYYENYLIEAADYGKTEVEVLEELGNPQKLSISIIEGLKNEGDVEMKNTAPKENQSFSELFDGLVESTSQTIDDALKVVDKTVGNISEYLSDIFGNEDFFEDSRQMTKDMEVIGDVKEEISLDIMDYEEVIFKIADLPIYAYFADENEMKITVSQTENKEPLLEVSHDDKKIVIREKKAKIYRLFGIRQDYVKVALPLNYKGKLYFKCDNSKIEISGTQTKYPSPIEIKCDNGNVSIKNAILGMLNIKCDNGKIDLRQVIAYKANLKCNNGKIGYDMIPNHYAKNLRLKASNGLIKVNDKRWSSSRVSTQIPALNDSDYELSVEAKCDNGLIRLKGF